MRLGHSLTAVKINLQAFLRPDAQVRNLALGLRA